MIDGSTFSGEIHRGAGVVARWPGICIVTPHTESNGDALNEMYSKLNNRVTPEDALDLVESKAAELQSIAAIIQTTEGTFAVLYGPMLVTANNDQFIQGEDELKHIKLDNFEVITLTVYSENPSESMPPYDLREGIAAGAGLTLQRLNAVPKVITEDGTQSTNNAVSDILEAETSDTENLDEQTESSLEKLETVETSGQKPIQHSLLLSTIKPTPSKPLPLAGSQDTKAEADSRRVEVEGITCTREHFNNPEAKFCMICGVSMTHLDREPVKGLRPTLGFIIFDDGATFGLDRSYIMGRNPEPTDDPTKQTLRLFENNDTLSRNHADLLLDDWKVKIVDRNSTNGTFIWEKENETWIQLEPNEEVELSSGTTVALGRRAFVYESVDESANNELDDQTEQDSDT